VGKIDQSIFAASVSKKLPKVNNGPMGENSPNMVTLLFAIIETVCVVNRSRLKRGPEKNINKYY
jgi:hypothetical protein